MTIPEEILFKRVGFLWCIIRRKVAPGDLQVREIIVVVCGNRMRLLNCRWLKVCAMSLQAVMGTIETTT
jgi:hypothetical protein